VHLFRKPKKGKEKREKKEGGRKKEAANIPLTQAKTGIVILVNTLTFNQKVK